MNRSHVGVFGLAADTDCAAVGNASLAGCQAVAGEHGVLDFLGVSCRHLNEYSYGLVEVDAATRVATVILRDKAGQVIQDQIHADRQCMAEIVR